MVIQESSQSGAYILEGSGRLDFKARHMFQTAMKAAQTSKESHIVFDLSDVTFVDSAGLALLILANRESKEHNVLFSLCQPRDTIKEVFELTNMAKHVSIFNSMADALSHKQQPVLR